VLTKNFEGSMEFCMMMSQECWRLHLWVVVTEFVIYMHVNMYCILYLKLK